jgi:hypothetical protein
MSVRQHAIAAPPPFSLLRSSGAARLAIACVALVALWLGVFWAMQ